MGWAATSRPRPRHCALGTGKEWLWVGIVDGACLWSTTEWLT
ncbi:MAG: hypothetical protein AAGF95_19500 [Chloroflexota bacterium]